MRAGRALKKKVLIGGVTLVSVVLVIAVLRPVPIEVEVAKVARGALQVTVDEEGETRVRDRFVISAPVGGRMARIEFVKVTLLR